MRLPAPAFPILFQARILMQAIRIPCRNPSGLYCCPSPRAPGQRAGSFGIVRSHGLQASVGRTPCGRRGTGDRASFGKPPGRTGGFRASRDPRELLKHSRVLPLHLWPGLARPSSGCPGRTGRSTRAVPLGARVCFRRGTIVENGLVSSGPMQTGCDRVFESFGAGATAFQIPVARVGARTLSTAMLTRQRGPLRVPSSRSAKRSGTGGWESGRIPVAAA
jgi:hypothetical protein